MKFYFGLSWAFRRAESGMNSRSQASTSSPKDPLYQNLARFFINFSFPWLFSENNVAVYPETQSPNTSGRAHMGTSFKGRYENIQVGVEGFTQNV